MAQPDAALLQDLCSRFILNVPAEELKSFERLLFYVEEAHWYYEDFERERKPEEVLQSMSLKHFARLIFKECPGLAPFSASLDKIYRAFAEYKQGIPVVGAIMINPGMDQCLLVRGWGTQASWGFPRGKVNEAEPDSACAIREVFEETGFDVRARLQENSCAEIWEKHAGSQKRTKLFFIPDVDASTEFAPQARKEISALAWHSIAELPTTYEENSQRFESVGSGVDERRHNFWGVWQYMRPLMRWIKAQRRAAAGRPATNARTPTSVSKAGGTRQQPGGVKAAGGERASVSFAGLAGFSAPALPPPFVMGGLDVGPVAEEGTAFLQFKFDRATILQHLSA